MTTRIAITLGPTEWQVITAELEKALAMNDAISTLRHATEAEVFEAQRRVLVLGMVLSQIDL